MNAADQLGVIFGDLTAHVDPAAVAGAAMRLASCQAYAIQHNPYCPLTQEPLHSAFERGWKRAHRAFAPTTTEETTMNTDVSPGVKGGVKSADSRRIPDVPRFEAREPMPPAYPMALPAAPPAAGLPDDIVAATFGEATVYVDPMTALGAALCLHYAGSRDGFAFVRNAYMRDSAAWERVRTGWLHAEDRFGLCKAG